jgi:hypothetical protein
VKKSNTLIDNYGVIYPVRDANKTVRTLLDRRLIMKKIEIHNSETLPFKVSAYDPADKPLLEENIAYKCDIGFIRNIRGILFQEKPGSPECYYIKVNTLGTGTECIHLPLGSKSFTILPEDIHARQLMEAVTRDLYPILDEEQATHVLDRAWEVAFTSRPHQGFSCRENYHMLRSTSALTTLYHRLSKDTIRWIVNNKERYYELMITVMLAHSTFPPADRRIYMTSS